MVSNLRALFFGVLVIAAVRSYSQAPVISYSSPQTYVAGTAITALTPTSSGVAAPGYSASAVVLGSGFNSPYGLAVDAAGNVYVADKGHQLVKKIPVGGGAPITLGSGYNGPYGVAVDGAGNVYVADGVNGAMMIPSGGGSQVAIGAGFSSSYGVAVDAKGNVYVADNSAIIKIPVGGGAQLTLGTVSEAYGLAVDAAGNIFVANGSASIAEIPAIGGGAPVNIGSGFSNPEGVAVDAAGNIYVADYGHNSIKKIPAGGGATVAIGPGFTTPYGLAVDGAGNVYVGATGNNAVKEITPVGGYYAAPFLPAGLNFNTTTGVISGTPATGSPATSYTVTAYNSSGKSQATVNITVNPASSVPVTISYSSPKTYTAGIAITALVPAGSGIASPGFSNNMTAIGSGFSNPEGLAVDAGGNVYIADYNNGVVKKIPVGGGSPVTLGSFAQPNGVAVDVAGNVYVSDGGVGIMKIPAGGGTPVSVGSGITDPQSIALDVAGNVYLSDLGDHTIKEIPVGGGSPIVLGTSGEFLSPYGVAIDAAGNVYVADLEANEVKKIPAGGGSPVILGSNFSVPYGVAVDAAGNVYVADSGNKLIKEIPAGTGSPVTIGSGFLNPIGITLDGAGNIYVSDQINNTVKEIKPVGGCYATPFLPAGLNFNTATGTISGTPAAASAATNYSVTAYNNTGSNSAIVNIRVVPSASASLAGLSTSSGKLSPVFATGTLNYAVPVSNATTTITVTPVASDVSSTITVNGVGVASGSASGAIALNVGPNIVTTVVTAMAGTPAATYTLTVNRAPSANAYLTNLKVTTATLSPAFAFKTLSYTASVSNSTASVTVTPTVLEPNATIKVNGAAVVSKTASGLIALTVGPNTINIVVTAQDGVTTKSYAITVTRAPSANANLAGLKLSTGALSPTFTAGTTSYTASVANATSSVTVTPTTAVTTATVTVNGVAVASGTASGAIALNAGPNIITTVVTAQDGITTKTYTITVTRAPSTNAYLSNLKVTTATLSPAFAFKTFAYTSSVPNATSSVTVTPTLLDATASVKVNGTAVADKTASGAIALALGSNTITVSVTAQDGVSTQTYTVTITRASGGADSYEPISVTNPAETPALVDDGILVHRGVSPNGDGIEDFLQIDNISRYPDNKLSIMNRNGQLVYEAKGYDNSSKTFDGHSNKNGQMQLPGTYFYQLDYTVNGVTKHKTGFLVLKY